MNQLFQRLHTWVGWGVFAIAALVYALTAEPTTSLWDCGEFISAAHKLQVVHPPGAPLFLMIGRMFIVVAQLFSDNPENIAYAVNFMSGITTAFLVLFITWSTSILARLALVGRRGQVENWGQAIAILGAGVVAGLATTFSNSIWFSAVEGEVYAMSAGFTGLVIWGGLHWYISDRKDADRWLVLLAYMAGLSIGVHLLSLLVIPFVAMLFYFKKRELKLGDAGNRSVPFVGTSVAFVAGFAVLMLVQAIIIPKVPQLAASFDFFFVNSLKMGVGTGMIAFVIGLLAATAAVLWYSHKIKHYYLQLGTMMFLMVLLGFSTYGTIVLRAEADTPINMNAPKDPYSLLSYINREQYGDRPLLYGPSFAAQPNGITQKGVNYRPVTDEVTGKTRYEKVGDKIEYTYASKDMMLFPRLGHSDRGELYRRWLDLKPNEKITMSHNLQFAWNYQFSWMYVRYFMWNFAGRQNAQQGFYAWDKRHGNWLSGVGFVDGIRLHDQSEMPEDMRKDKGRNTYFFLPLIFGLLGMFFHFRSRPQEAVSLFALFITMGIAIIVFTNQPPNEPRERDYVLVGSFFTFCIWIGMAVPFFYQLLKDKVPGAIASAGPFALVLSAPLLMGYFNWDDNSRANHYGARDYAINFLESCAPNAIIFTYGDNDTYPLWYAQEVENIRPDVRVINFSLLGVDWYINQLRRKINESPAVKMSMPMSAYRGDRRNVVPMIPTQGNKPMDLLKAVLFMSEDKTPPIQGGENYQGYYPAKVFSLPVDAAKVKANNMLPYGVVDSMISPEIIFDMGKDRVFKDDVALLDIIATNAANGWERPIYFAVTVRPEKLGGLRDYLQLEGMAVRLTPVRKPIDERFAGSMFMSPIDLDRMYDNVMNKFRWGNFDKKDLFVDESYMPSIQSLQYALLRLAEELARADQKDKAIAVLDRYFEAFPHMNFPLHRSRSASQALGLYYTLGAKEKAAPLTRQMAQALAETQAFYEHLGALEMTGSSAFDLCRDPAKRARTGQGFSSFCSDIQDNLGNMQGLIMAVQAGRDEAMLQEVGALFKPYGVEAQAMPRMPMPGE